jgi:catechol 2,3-dioxygenase-like lactoylglutathione lyase family enzyme
MKITLVSMPVKDPVEAHEIYTTRLGFQSVEFDAEAGIAVVVSPEDPKGTAILLEPCAGNFAGDFQQAAFEANLPVMVFGVPNAKMELLRLKSEGVVIRPDLDREEYGLKNLFEDGCGNLLMLHDETD